MAIVSIDGNEEEGFDYAINLKSHVYKTIDEVFIVALVPRNILEKLRMYGGRVTYCLKGSSLDCLPLDLGGADVKRGPLGCHEACAGAPAYLTAHSRATLANCSGFVDIMDATWASCGSFGSGLLRSD